MLRERAEDSREFSPSPLPAPRLDFGHRTIAGVAYSDAEKAVLDVLYFHLRGRRYVFDIYSDIAFGKLDSSRACLGCHTTGGTPRKLGVPGEQLPKVTYQVRDASRYRRHRLLCVGGGDSAIEAAMGLAGQSGNKVVISYRKEQCFRIKKKNEERLAKLVKRGRIQLIMQSQVLEISETSVRLDTPKGETRIDNDFVFVLIGGISPFDLLRRSGIRFGNEV